MRNLTNERVRVSVVGLPGWDPQGLLKHCLETLGDMAQYHIQRRPCFRNLSSSV